MTAPVGWAPVAGPAPWPAACERLDHMRGRPLPLGSNLLPMAAGNSGLRLQLFEGAAFGVRPTALVSMDYAWGLEFQRMDH
jgi:hypothetical protein